MVHCVFPPSSLPSPLFQMYWLLQDHVSLVFLSLFIVHFVIQSFTMFFLFFELRIEVYIYSKNHQIIERSITNRISFFINHNFIFHHHFTVFFLSSLLQLSTQYIYLDTTILSMHCLCSAALTFIRSNFSAYICVTKFNFMDTLFWR